MKKTIASLHVSLDGKIAGNNGEMDWIKINGDLFDFVNTLTLESDTAMYGRKTWEIMDSYWPTAADQPNATKHDMEHSAWYMQSNKYVITSQKLTTHTPKTYFINPEDISGIESVINGKGGQIMIFGSGNVVRLLIKHKLLNELILMINPVLVGTGNSLFDEFSERNMKLIQHKHFDCGVMMLRYAIG